MRRARVRLAYSQPSQIVKLAGSSGAEIWPRDEASSFACSCAAFMALSMAASFSSSVIVSSFSPNIADAFIVFPLVILFALLLKIHLFAVFAVGAAVTTTSTGCFAHAPSPPDFLANPNPVRRAPPEAFAISSVLLTLVVDCSA